MKKILFLIPTLGGGGAERVLVNLINNLDRTKYQITVQTLFKPGINAQFLHNHVTLRKGHFRQFHGNVWLFKLFSPKVLCRFFIREKYDIVVSYLEGPTARIVSAYANPTAKLISWVHTEELSKKHIIYSFRSEQEAKKCYSAFNYTVCVSNAVRQAWLRWLPTEHCIVLYNTNDQNIIRSLSTSSMPCPFSEPPNVISIGRLIPAKGFDRLIESHKKILDDGVTHHLYILGDGSDWESLTCKINDLGVTETCHLLGFKENPYPYLAKADLFVCSSRREGFSTAVTESLILGVPVVSTCCSGAYELLGQNNEYGIVTENSTDGIFAGMKKMLTDPHTLQHYKQQAALRGAQFSKEKTVAAVEALLDSL